MPVSSSAARRLGLQPIDLRQDLLDRRPGHRRRDVRVLRPVGVAIAHRQLAVRRVGVALVLADVLGDAGGERAAEQRIHHRQRDEVRRSTDRRSARPRITVDCGAPGRSTMWTARVDVGFGGRLGRRAALVPPGEGLPDRRLDRRLVEPADDVEARSAGAVGLLVEAAGLIERVALDHLLGRKHPAVGVVAVHHRRGISAARSAAAGSARPRGCGACWP